MDSVNANFLFFMFCMFLIGYNLWAIPLRSIHKARTWLNYIMLALGILGIIGMFVHAYA